MENLLNRFYRGIVYSPSSPKHPNFRYVYVDTVYEKEDEDGNPIRDSFVYYRDHLINDIDLEDIFYLVYGSYWIDIPKSGLVITETNSLQKAIVIAEEIIGNKITEIEIPIL